MRTFIKIISTILFNIQVIYLVVNIIQDNFDKFNRLIPSFFDRQTVEVILIIFICFISNLLTLLYIYVMLLY